MTRRKACAAAGCLFTGTKPLSTDELEFPDVLVCGEHAREVRDAPEEWAVHPKNAKDQTLVIYRRSVATAKVATAP